MKKSSKSAFFTKTLLQWHRESNERTMPWKAEPDPYKIWLSEIILQQTRVQQGMGYYLRFIERFPSVEQLAGAEDNVIFKLWEGLGYYSRCRNLIHTARYISADLGGKFPSTYEEIIKLKGIGPYTASAIASFAFGLPNAVIDGNVNRVIARYFGLHIPVDSTEGKRLLAAYANALLDKSQPAHYNQAIMDFGATICKPRQPMCDRCFLSGYCTAYNENVVDLLPIKEKKLVRRKRWFYYLVLEQEGRFAVSKRSGKDIWHSLHEFPLLEETSQLSPEAVLQSGKAKRLLARPYTVVDSSPFYKQVLTHQDIYGCFTHIQISGKSLPAEYEMLSKKDITYLAFPKLINDYLSMKGWGKKSAANE